MPKLELVILIGMYAQRYYLKEKARKTLTETAENYQDYLPFYFPIPHPSPRNRFWLTNTNLAFKCCIKLVSFSLINRYKIEP
jgi:uracil-DNA glycosylase